MAGPPGSGVDVDLALDVVPMAEIAFREGRVESHAGPSSCCGDARRVLRRHRSLNHGVPSPRSKAVGRAMAGGQDLPRCRIT